ncbi:Tfp pilus assembly protein tip-associated adhesin PilY1-like protein [Paracidovorax avenae ATCC 19860]|uniref:Tfp pilus assembly protein tip-associated adhesin PilY1-like protein n=1 Tax=Paracidovorax avenae (strain ATCC 19860 / DSM 7227 / CCUG 15838 / JCM 20985 / LMG 2117 / NCPPB 1011) TaxID=643561 RepID=F0QAX7_PARA1|nr:PilC/PilY family type IV pilus protein [Paracidovorax avenae]ADX47365.1 Tfp pilus assembly protein tip-associated adhesin PilY1-like protein [Paracidovorax avenae ATCC 19860]
MNSQSPSHRPSLRQRGFINKPFLGAVAVLVGLFAFGTSFLAMGTGAPVTTPPINLSSDPLYAVNVKDKPTMALALSVEFPTVGAQYVNVPNTNTDDSYANTKEYLGYYDAESCYQYNDAPTETPESGRTAADYKRFDPIGRATNRKCSNAFSGNFLNWATNSAVDMLRLALSGGDRYVDTSTLTILQRAVLPNGDPICMWNSNNFPAKRLTKDGGGANSYWGAVPTAMVTGANGNDIWVANTLNRVYFRAGSSAAGSCSDTSGYTLGAPTTTQSRGTTTYQNNVALPNDAVLCTAENSMCNFTGVREVWFGVPPTRLTPRGNWAIVPASNGINCNYQVIGDPAPGQGKSCYTRPYTGTWQPPQTTALNSDGFFYSRVQVCNKTDDLLQDIRDYGLCTQYPSGNYKPVGVIQKYSDQLRLAAFGYLMDQTASYNNGRYGGVLRAPMKYVGQKTFDVLGREETATNAKSEWNINTGIFNKNPESDTVFGISGVINYLNQFGRTGPVPGRYKQYDPVGELYYQALRYMQGLPPTADAISGLGTPSTGSALYDGYPVYTDWTNIDPYGGARSSSENYSCVRSNIVVIGDINTHDGNWRNIPTSDDPANNATNFRTWHQVVQSFEKGISTAYVDGQGVNRTTSNPNTANPNVPANSQTSQIMGYAYWAHTQDIRGTRWTAATAKQRPGLRVKTFLFDVNEYATQNDAATRQTRNQFFMAAKYGGFNSTSSSSSSGSPDPYNTYGNPFRNQITDTNDNNVWQKPSAPGEASSYYLQSDARGVLAAFRAIFENSIGSARSIAGSSSASRVQASTDNFLYSAKFDVASWTGDVIAEQITRSGSGSSVGLSVSSNPVWSAAARLKIKNAADRKIFAGHGSRLAATEFTWSAINGKAMQTSLSKASPSATADSLGPDRLNYLRGVRTNEGAGAQFRVRTELLGDIVNSGVTFSGPPAAAFTGNSYALFKTENAGRSPVVFAGANDGMLHAFAAQTDTGKGITAGDELFAYIPSWMGPKLSALTSPTYVNNHQAYVDAPSAVGEAQVAFTSGAGSATDWKTVLVSGTGAGGRGVFALDVSKPETFAVGNALWEFTGADDADMGFVVGRPQILKFRTGADTYRWFAVVASGADNYSSSFDNGGGGGRPALFLLALDKASGDAWVEGTNYFKLIFPVDTAVAATVATGMANFTPLYALAGDVTQIYAGDLHGKVWKLDFTCTRSSATDTSCTSYGYKATSNWTVAGLSSFGSGGTPYPFFIAKDASGNVQPITSAPQLFTGPIVDGKETFYVLVGTGKYLESSDRTSTRAQSVYALYDNGSTTADSSNPASAISGRSRMTAGTVSTSAQTVTVPSFKWGRPQSDGDTTQRAGWYIDLPTSGERSISGFTDLGGLTVAFSTVIPGDVASAGACDANPGSGRQYTLDVSLGNGSTAESRVGLLSAFVVIEDTASSTVTNYDSTGQAIRTIMKRSLQTGSSGVTEGKSTTVQEVVGRLSWRQIYDYRQLRKDATTP